MSWVIAMAVLPRRLTQSTMRPSITAPMIGSSPVVGSSKNRISGCAAIARARPTRFCMPPESSEGAKSPTLGSRPTCANTVSARLRASPRASFCRANRPNATFSQTVRLSNSAAAWNSMPIRALIASRASRSSVSTFTPSISIDPASGSINPRMQRSSTDLPVPEPPITTIEVPAATSRSTPSSTRLVPNAFFRPRTRIFGTDALIGRRTTRSSRNRTPG